MKTGTITKLVVLIILLVFLVFVLIKGINSGFDIFHFDISPHINIGVKSNGLDKGKVVENGSMEIDSTGITHLDIEWIAKSVTLKPYDGSTINFTETSDKELDDDERMRYEIQDSKLSIYYCKNCKEEFSFYDDTPSKSLEVLIPKALMLDSLDVKSVSAYVKIEGINATNLEVDSVSGTTETHGTYTNVDLTNISGETFFNANATELESESVSGDTVLTGTYSNIDCESISGDIVINTPETAEFTLEVETVSGSTELGFQNTMKNDEYIVGSGDSEFDIDTVSGDISVVPTP